MSLTPGEIASFSKALADACTLDELQELVIFTRGQTLDRYVPASATKPLACALLVMGASSEGWERQLLDKAVEKKPKNPLLDAFAAQYRSTPSPVAVDPCDAPLLRAQRLFIDRQDLRARLRELTSAKAARVLVIRGERYSGKSHSRFLMDHLAENGGGFRSVVVDLAAEEINSPDELASVIVAKIGGDARQLPPQGLSTAPRWGLFLATAIQNEVKSRGYHFWLVFDGLNKDGLSTETLGVILNLAIRAELDVPAMRVVLIDLEGNLPPEIDDRALREQIGRIDEEKCLSWLKTVLTLHKVPPQ
jgi:hypothetical protein